MNILLIDNYDSFTYNIVALLKQQDFPFTIRKNDELNLEETKQYTHIIISPGPSLPKDSGLVPDIIQYCFRTHALLGICLGHQAIAQCFGGDLEALSFPRHGYRCDVKVCSESLLFRDIPDHFKAGLYHSWTVSEKNFPQELRITSRSSSGDILSIEHKDFPVFGIQFHPESYMSEYGINILHNFLRLGV